MILNGNDFHELCSSSLATPKCMAPTQTLKVDFTILQSKKKKHTSTKFQEYLILNCDSCTSKVIWQ